MGHRSINIRGGWIPELAQHKVQGCLDSVHIREENWPQLFIWIQMSSNVKTKQDLVLLWHPLY